MPIVEQASVAIGFLVVTALHCPMQLALAKQVLDTWFIHI